MPLSGSEPNYRLQSLKCPAETGLSFCRFDVEFSGSLTAMRIERDANRAERRALAGRSQITADF